MPADSMYFSEVTFITSSWAKSPVNSWLMSRISALGTIYISDMLDVNVPSQKIYHQH
jgi:hypothetical protein